MFARRLAGALLAPLILHLTLVSADVTCAEHGSRSASVHQHGGSHGDRIIAQAQMTATATDKPCQTPTQPQCCRAMVSCAVNATSERSMRPADLPPVRGVIEPAIWSLPRSQIASPDPPPPKA